MSEISFDFTGRTVLVTGAARGIGLELARGFQSAGASTYLLDADGEEVQAAAHELGARGLRVDVGDTDEVGAALRQAHEETGRVDVIVNNAGILRDKMLWKLTDDDWELVLRVHAGGTFRMTRAAVPYFREQGYGRVVNITSFTGLHGNLGQANYAAAKAGIIGFTKTAAWHCCRTPRRPPHDSIAPRLSASPPVAPRSPPPSRSAVSPTRGRCRQRSASSPPPRPATSRVWCCRSTAASPCERPCPEFPEGFRRARRDVGH